MELNRKLEVILASHENRAMAGTKLGDRGGTGVVLLSGPLRWIEQVLGIWLGSWTRVSTMTLRGTHHTR